MLPSAARSRLALGSEGLNCVITTRFSAELDLSHAPRKLARPQIVITDESSISTVGNTIKNPFLKFNGKEIAHGF
jgi:hypothetical protein